MSWAKQVGLYCFFFFSKQRDFIKTNYVKKKPKILLDDTSHKLIDKMGVGKCGNNYFLKCLFLEIYQDNIFFIFKKLFLIYYNISKGSKNIKKNNFQQKQF